MGLRLTVMVTVTLLAALFWMLFFYRQDAGRPEPPLRVLGCLLLGAIAVGPAIGWEAWAARWVNEQTGPGQFITAFAVVGLGEEAVKFGAAWLGAYRRPERLHLPVDAMIYAIAAGIGFAAVENILYARTFGMEVLFLRAVVGFVVHAAFSGLFGYVIGVGVHRGMGLGAAAVRGVGLAALFHGLYDWVLLSGWLPPSGVLWAVGGLYVLLATRIEAAREAPV